jgi:hypothetical protein
VLTALKIVASLTVIVVGVLAGRNYRGITSRFAVLASRPNSRLAPRRGPHRWGNVVTQTLVYRAYGWLAVVVGLVLLNFSVHG